MLKKTFLTAIGSAALALCLCVTSMAAQLPDFHPVAYQRRKAFPAELAPGTALQHLMAGIDIVKPTEGFFDPSLAQNVITCDASCLPLK